MDAKFFRKAKRLNRAVEITDTEAVIPAVKDSPEIRVPLPNRRPKTFEERSTALQARYDAIAALEEQIVTERKTLLDLVKAYKAAGSGVADVVVQNLKIRSMMEQRSALARPETWIETLQGLTLVDIFESKRDIRKIGEPVYQVKRRLEPITSLYVDLGVAAAQAAVQIEAADAAAAAAVVKAEADAAAARRIKTIAASALPTEADAAAAATGAIIGRKKITLKKKTAPV
jgi:hypothetical protein